MADEERRDQEEVSLGIANELVEFANSKVDAGVHPMDVASACCALMLDVPESVRRSIITFSAESAKRL
jgi:hypothetical protein